MCRDAHIHLSFLMMKIFSYLPQVLYLLLGLANPEVENETITPLTSVGERRGRGDKTH